jgi:alpha-L-fucosidase
MYVHVFSWPFKHLHLDGFSGRVEYAQLLNDDSEIKMIEDLQAPRGGHADRKTLTLEIPVKKPDAEVPVIELFLKE